MCVVDGVFEEVTGDEVASVDFHPATGIDETAVAQVQATLRRRILRGFVGRGLLESFEAQEMLGYAHSGFSVDAGVCIESQDRAGLERLLRYCAGPPFAMESLRKAGSELVYRCSKRKTLLRGPSRSAPAFRLLAPRLWAMQPHWLPSLSPSLPNAQPITYGPC